MKFITKILLGILETLL